MSDEMSQISTEIENMIEHIQKSLVIIKRNELELKKLSTSLIQLTEGSEKYVIGIVDIIDSTSICATLKDKRVNDLYQIFINGTSEIVKKHGGIVAKNIGDSILFYFPIQSVNETEILLKCLECCVDLSQTHKFIATRLEEKNLPVIDYRISATYGTVNVAKTSTSDVKDVFGTTVNKCAKLNHYANRNGIVIGRNFYLSISEFSNYLFKEIQVPNELDFKFKGYHVILDK